MNPEDKMPVTIDRRMLLKIGAGGLGALAFGAAGPSAAGGLPDRMGKIRGVNLGGWLVLEKWMSPTLFKGVEADDEYHFSEKLGINAGSKLRAHRDRWIKESDFKWIGERGLNTVRLPIGYWALGGEAPFVGSAEYIDRTFAWAKKYGLQVLLDIHGAPGSQNGWDHSGKAGTLGWHTIPENITRTLDFVEKLSERYSKEDNLLGIELLNEPRWDVPIDILKKYYQDAYKRVRKHLPPDKATVFIHDGFRPLEWANFMQEPEYSGIILDTHLYQCYTPEDKKRSIYEQIRLAGYDRKLQLDAMSKQLWTCVGEWSIALDPANYVGLSSFEKDTARRAYGAAQLLSYETTRGWIYWSYKTQEGGEWSFRNSVERGWLPNRCRDTKV